MISRLLVGISRSLFTAAILLAFGALLLAWVSFKVLKAALKDAPQMPVRDAAFTTLAALAQLSKTLRERIEP